MRELFEVRLALVDLLDGTIATELTSHPPLEERSEAEVLKALKVSSALHWGAFSHQVVEAALQDEKTCEELREVMKRHKWRREVLAQVPHKRRCPFRKAA